MGEQTVAERDHIFFGSEDQSRNPFGRCVTGQKMGFDFMKDFKILCKITV